MSALLTNSGLKHMFYSHVIGQTLTASNTTYTGHVVSNNSTTVNLRLYRISLVVSVTSASLTGIALAINAQPATPTSTTVSDSSGNCFLGGAVSKGIGYKAATLANAGTAIFGLMHNDAAIATTGVDSIMINLNGTIVIPPAYTFHLVALGAASAASAITSSFQWSEEPI